jgi:hypothetical protein
MEKDIAIKTISILLIAGIFFVAGYYFHKNTDHICVTPVIVNGEILVHQGTDRPALVIVSCEK